VVAYEHFVIVIQHPTTSPGYHPTTSQCRLT